MAIKRHQSSVMEILILFFADALAVSAGVLSAYWLRFQSGLIPLYRAVPPLEWYIHPLGIVVLVFFLRLHSCGLYDPQQRWPLAKEVGAILRATTQAVFWLMVLTFLPRDLSYSRVTLALAWFFISFFLITVRFSLSFLQSWWRHQQGRVHRILFVGLEAPAQRLVQQIRANPRWGYTIAGIASRHNPHPEKISGLPVLGTLKKVQELFRIHRVTDCILTESGIPKEEIAQLAAACEREMVTFRLLPDALGLVPALVPVEELGGIPLLGMKPIPLDDPWNRFLKRAMDVTLSVIGLTFLVPLFFLIGFWIRLDSPGPIFYLQNRLGQDGKSFRMWKFRTMQAKAENKTGPVWTKADDSRRTRLGIFLRCYNLDELPQLINILKGEMSLVGPRPERPHFVRQFKEDVPRYMARHRIRAGMTGWAQIHGLRGDTSIQERTQYDLYYLEHWSVWLDLKILLRSFLSVKNAY